MTDSKRFARKGSVPRLTDTGRARRDADDATRLRIQLAENTKRTDLTAIELANAYVRLMALEKPLGKTQKQVAEEVGTTQARFSKYLALSKAPENIQKVSSEDGLQDLDLLYNLKKAHDSDPKATTAMLTKWRQDPESKSPLRLLSLTSSSAKPRRPPRPSRSAPPTPTRSSSLRKARNGALASYDHTSLNNFTISPGNADND